MAALAPDRLEVLVEGGPSGGQITRCSDCDRERHASNRVSKQRQLSQTERGRCVHGQTDDSRKLRWGGTDHEERASQT